MIVASWNVNSLAVRMPRLVEFLGRYHPDVVCLQETKTRTEAFPHLEVQMAGYSALDHSSGGRNGVAILVRDGLAVDKVSAGLSGERNANEARWIQAQINGVTIACVYVPNGRSLQDPAFDDKLIFLDAIVGAAEQMPEPIIIAGDFNIAPADPDVYDPVHYIGTTHTSATERAVLQRLEDLGLRDAFRCLHPEEQRFTWWDYRGGNFHKNLGMRIDLLMISSDLLAGASDYEMARDFRKGSKPSDHAPILLTVDVPTPSVSTG